MAVTLPHDLLRHLTTAAPSEAWAALRAFALSTFQREMDPATATSEYSRRDREIASADFVGFRLVSTTVVSLLYVMVTRDGPVAVRIDAYSFKKDLHISQIHITRKWDEMMRLVDSVRLLPATMELKFESMPE